MAGERINISKVVDGKVLVQSVAAEKLAAAQDDGWDVATGEDTQRYKYEREVMARPGAQFEAGFEGFSRALSLGASDAVLAAVVDDEERKAMGVRSETGAADVGEALGTGATLLSATGALRALGGRAAAAEGSALLRAGGRATQLTDSALASTPLGLVTRGAARVGEAVERGVIGDATAGVARRALARGVGLGTEGAIEGAAVGAGQEVSETALGDTELTAQKLLAGAGRGAMFGGLTGAAIGAPLGAAAGALGAPRVLAGRAARQAGDALDAATASAQGHVAPDIARSLGDRATDLYSTAASKVSGKAKSEIEFGIRNRDARADYWRLPELKKASTERASAALDEMKSLRRLEKRIASRDFGSEGLAKSIRRDAGAAEFQSARAVQLVDEMAMASAAKRVGGSEVKRLLNSAREGVTAAAKSRDPGLATHKALESLRSGLDDMRTRAQGGADTPELSQLHEWADIHAQRADGLLNDTEVWGTAGAQRAERAAAVDAVRKTKRDFDGRFFQVKSSDAADPAKIAAHFERIGDASKDYSHVQSIRHLDERLKLYDVLERNGDVPPDLADELAKARAVTTKLKADFSEMGDRIGGANRVSALYAEDAFTRMMGGTPATVLGSITGGPGGAAAGFAIDALRNPGALVQRLGAIESLADRVRRVDAKIGNSVRSFVRQETAPALREGSERKVRRSIRASSAASAAAVTQVSERKRTKEVQRKIDAVREYTRDPVPTTDAFVRRTMRGVSDYAPGVAMGIAGTHARAMQFLAAKLPPIPRTQLSVLQPQLTGHVLAPSQVDKLSRYIGAIEDPVEIIEDMRTGLLTPESVEAIQAVYPDLYASMRSMAILEVASAKEPLSHTAVVRLSLLFGFAGSPTLEPAFQMTHSAIMEQRQQTEAQGPAPAPPGNAPDMTANSQTQSQRLVVGM
jgi:gas vesicle protein